MPKMPDAEIVLGGTALFITSRTEFESDKPNGADVAILGSSGLAIVRYTQDHVRDQHLPQTGRPVAVVATGSSYAMDKGAANVVYRYVRPAGENDLGDMHKTIKAAASA